MQDAGNNLGSALQPEPGPAEKMNGCEGTRKAMMHGGAKSPAGEEQPRGFILIYPPG